MPEPQLPPGRANAERLTARVGQAVGNIRASQEAAKAAAEQARKDKEAK